MAKWGKYLSIGKYSNELSSKNSNSPHCAYDVTAATLLKPCQLVVQGFHMPLQGQVHTLANATILNFTYVHFYKLNYFSTYSQLRYFTK